MINFFDMFVVIVTAGLAILGFREGLVRGAINLVGFILVVILLAANSDAVMTIAGRFDFLPEHIAGPIVFIVLLIISTIIVHIVAYVLHKIVHMTPMGFVDSGLGCAFGILKSLLLCGVVAILLSCASPGGFFRRQFDSSIMAGTLADLVAEAVPQVKQSVAPYLRNAPINPRKDDQNSDDKTIPPNFI